MAKLYSNYGKQLDDAVKTSFTDIINVVKEQLEESLFSNRTAEHKQQPQKSASTIKQYTKKGYDTHNWLVRTGQSTELDIKVGTGNITITPKHPEILDYHKETSAEWFNLNDDSIKKINEVLNEHIRNIN